MVTSAVSAPKESAFSSVIDATTAFAFSAGVIAGSACIRRPSRSVRDHREIRLQEVLAIKGREKENVKGKRNKKNAYPKHHFQPK